MNIATRSTGRTCVRFAALALVALVALVVSGLAGCSSSSNTNAVSYGDISGNLTPELKSTAQRPVDIDSALASNQNKNWRSFWDDLGRAFFTDEPSRLSPFPISNTTGQPR